MDFTLSNDPGRVIEADRAHVWHHLSQHKPYENGVDPRIIVEGKGMKVWDIKGKEHIDAVSGGVWTVNVGYGRERIGKAIADEVTKMCFFGGMAGTIPGANFAEMLIDKMPGLDRVYYSNSGSEANEKGFKMVRQISHKHHGGKKSKILYRERDYHGTTIATLSAGGQEERGAQYGPYTPGFVSVPHCLEYRSQDGSTGEAYSAASLKAIEDVILREGADTIGSICLEPITAGGGIIVPPVGYCTSTKLFAALGAPALGSVTSSLACSLTS
jgi:taurine-pyruvate aminotransferase